MHAGDEHAIVTGACHLCVARLTSTATMGTPARNARVGGEICGNSSDSQHKEDPPPPRTPCTLLLIMGTRVVKNPQMSVVEEALARSGVISRDILCRGGL